MAERNFEDWLKRVDAIIQAKVGLSREDLPDIDYHGYFMQGMNCDRVAKIAIRNAKEY